MRRPSPTRSGWRASISWRRRAIAGGRSWAGCTWCARSSACTACASSRPPGARSARGAAPSPPSRSATASRASTARPIGAMTDGVVEIHADGACKGNPGRGGWGAILISGQKRKELHGGAPATTNNRMELTAVIEGLAALKKRSRVHVFTDSQYVQKGISEWIHAWKKRGWLTADRKPVKNDDLWRRLDELASGHVIEWHWVKGHAGDPENERADELANLGCAEIAEGLPAPNEGAA